MGQSKVSMVVPCYNKQEFIGDMLRSVYNQVWDNIELILVNDGSTDGTREVISAWEPKLRERGYEVVIIDQQNAGCCAAVYNGMLRMTGDYFCLVDCDDEILPEYVSKMAGWLDTHDDYDIAACNYTSYKGTRERQIVSYVGAQEFTPGDEGFLENFLLCRIFTGAWIYMARRKQAMCMAGHFCTERRKTYEPCIVIPLAEGDPKVKFFRESLYKFNLYANGFVGFQSMEQVHAYYDDYAYLHSWVINRLSVSEKQKKRLAAMGKLGCFKKKFSYAGGFPDFTQTIYSLTESLLVFLTEAFEDLPQIDLDRAVRCYNRLLLAAENGMLAAEGEPAPEYDRIIAYGALGQSAEKKLGYLKDTRLRPDTLWDLAAKSDSEICGTPVLPPDFNSLTDKDFVVILPGIKEVRDEIAESFKVRGFSNYLLFRDIHVSHYFPELYNSVFAGIGV